MITSAIPSIKFVPRGFLFFYHLVFLNNSTPFVLSLGVQLRPCNFFFMSSKSILPLSRPVTRAQSADPAVTGPILSAPLSTTRSRLDHSQIGSAPGCNWPLTLSQLSDSDEPLLPSPTVALFIQCRHQFRSFEPTSFLHAHGVLIYGC